MGAYDDDLDSLDDGVRRLKIEYDVFFNGNRKRPPEDIKARVDRLVRKLSEVADMSYGQRFRYTTMVTRLYVYKDKWRRMMMDREHGRAPGGAIPPAEPVAPIPADTARQEMIRIAIADPAAEGEKVQQLYDTLVELNSKASAGFPKLSLERFTEFIKTRSDGIRGKYHCSSVEFSISVESEALKFTAKPAS
jgi:hypothetical protein